MVVVQFASRKLPEAIPTTVTLPAQSEVLGCENLQHFLQSLVIVGSFHREKLRTQMDQNLRWFTCNLIVCELETQHLQ